MTTRPSRSLPPGLIPAAATLVLLAVPLVAMRYSEEVQWNPADFLVMGMLLLATGLGLEWAIRHRGPLVLRVAWTLALLSTFLMVWVNMAVGLLGGEGSPVNMLLLSVPALGAAGAVLARLQPRGMAFALLAMAAVHLLLTTIAASYGWRPLRQGPIDIWGPNGFFALLFLTASLLFWSAAGKVNRKVQGLLVAMLGIAVGLGGVLVGEADDAPGAGLIGIALLIGLVWLGLRLARRRD